jgi:hypothetical protein
MKRPSEQDNHARHERNGQSESKVDSSGIRRGDLSGESPGGITVTMAFEDIALPVGQESLV